MDYKQPNSPKQIIRSASDEDHDAPRSVRIESSEVMLESPFRVGFLSMGVVRNLLLRFGLADTTSERTPISVFLLDDDKRRHRWFETRFSGDDLDIAETVDDAKTFLAGGSYDAIFLDHDLLPHHYQTNDHDDYKNTGYAIAEWLNERSDLQRAATIIVHTRNADAAIPMVQKLRETGRNVEYVAFPMLDLKIRNYWKR